MGSRGRSVGVIGARFGAAVVAAAALGGCSQTAALFAPPPDSVQVSLLQLAQGSPEWAAVHQIDQNATLNRDAVPLTGLPVVPSPAGPALPLPRGTAPSDAAAASQHASVTSATAAFTVAAQKATARVDLHLERDEERLISAAQLAARQRITLGVEEARVEATQKYLEDLPALLAESSQGRTNLEVQIGALSADANPLNPRTAPDDYWGHLLQGKRAALAALPDSQLVAELQAQQQISEKVAAARASLQQSEDAQLAAYKATLELHRQQVLARQQAALQREKGELLAVSAQLDAQLGRPLAPAHALRSVADSSVASGETAAPPGATPLSDVDSAGAKAALQAQRDRLVVQILDETKHRALRAAGELHYKIVDWNAPSPSPAMMRMLQQRMLKDSSL